MSDDLITWLRAQLDDDERVAKMLTLDDVGAWSVERVGRVVDQHGREIAECTELGRVESEHIALWDPARVLAEVDAKRRILDLHPHQRFAVLPEEWPDRWKVEVKQAFPGTDQPYVGCVVDDFNSNYEVVEPDWWCPTVRLLALPYADRPGYREEWRP